MWGNETLLTPAPLWKHCPTWTKAATASKILLNYFRTTNGPKVNSIKELVES